jgi:hypothetical protein
MRVFGNELGFSHTRLGALRAAVSKPTALTVHETTAAMELARGVGTQEAEFIEL